MADGICTCGHEDNEHRERREGLTRRICLVEDCTCMEWQCSTLESIERAKKLKRPRGKRA